MGNKKIHSKDAGYIAERTNIFTGKKNVIYLAEEQGLDFVSGKYAVICDEHSTIIHTSNLLDARILMKDSTQFCDGCQKIKDKE